MEKTIRALCQYLKPTTLVAIRVDLHDSPYSKFLHAVDDVVQDALIANVGEEEARELLEKVER